MNQMNVKEAAVDGTTLGGRIRGLRKARGYTLNTLAAKIGKTAGFLSQVERGQANPSVGTIKALTAALDVPSEWFAVTGEASPDQEAGLIVRKGRRQRLRYGEAVQGGLGFSDDLISPNLDGDIFGLFTVFAPGGTWGKYTPSRSHEVLIYVVKGRLEITHEGRKHILNAGDSVQYKLYPEMSQHEVRNPSETEETHIVTVGTPVVLDT